MQKKKTSVSGKRIPSQSYLFILLDSDMRSRGPVSWTEEQVLSRVLELLLRIGNPLPSDDIASGVGGPSGQVIATEWLGRIDNDVFRPLRFWCEAATPSLNGGNGMVVRSS